jgi:hypothetical protein
MSTLQSKTASLLPTWFLLTLILLTGVAIADEAATPAGKIAMPAPDHSGGIEIAELELSSRIDGHELSVSLDFEAVTKLAHRRMLLIQGDVVLEKLNPAWADYKLDYDSKQKSYHAAWTNAGRHKIGVSFVAKSKLDPSCLWRETTLHIPTSRVRKITLVSDRPDLEVQLPGAMRIHRKVVQGQLTITAILGPHQPFVVRWKPQVELEGAKLVLSSQANTIVDVRAALMHVDTLFDFHITQGKI